jgi:hypothetical protein
LETIPLATVIECAITADPEKPGALVTFDLLARFLPEAEKGVLYDVPSGICIMQNRARVATEVGRVGLDQRLHPLRFGYPVFIFHRD